MKKVTRIILILAILSLSGCDFLRKVAGRPDSAALQVKSEQIAIRKRAVSDSIQRVQAQIRLEKKIVADSLAALEEIKEDGLNMSNVSRFGEPVPVPPMRYYLIVGVFRSPDVARGILNKFTSKGYEGGYLEFSKGVKAVYMMSANRISDMKDMADKACACGDCPADAWIYVNEQ